MNCKECQEQLVEYIDGTMDETARQDIEQHIADCDSCKQELANFKQIIAALASDNEAIQVPSDFMNNVRLAVTNTQTSRPKRYKRRATFGLVATLFLTLFVGTAVATNSFADFVDWLKDFSNKQDAQMQEFVQQGLAENVNVVAESNGVKVTITSVVADDLQTLIYYEVEALQQDTKYMINFTDGLQIANQAELWDDTDSPVTNSLLIYSESENVYKGRLGTAPISANEGTIHLKLSKLEQVMDAPVAGVEASPPIFMEGDWRFHIPVQKHPAIVYDLQVETEVDGNPVIFDKVTIAPTQTVLSYRYRNNNPDKKMDYLTIASLESKGKHVYPELLGMGGGGGSADGWHSSRATFESLYFDKPTEIRVHVGSAGFTVEESARFTIDIAQEQPQTFNYLGNTISIEQIEVGERTKIKMTEELASNRPYETLRYVFYDKDGRGSSSSSVDGYYIDNNGERHAVKDSFYRLQELQQPRIFSTEHQIELYRDDQPGDFIPTTLEIEGYTVTSFYDKVIDIPLDN
ncbi:DUF4179 domain-containing protein [Sporosarcina sp. YIM B06819]|uniref:DUF4179 domain-containing protein n=1 Tax=Sporosarcina sp. YIM B06819 TaxID=3081769 RepID=UPI00298D5A2B|nr:DUF4179 domain-containing protein [Sporosarcina sp. YIM B06819]